MYSMKNLYSVNNHVVNPHDPGEDEPEKRKKENPEHNPEHKPDVIILEDNRERRDGPGGD